MHVSVVNHFYVRGNTFGRLKVFFSARPRREDEQGGREWGVQGKGKAIVSVFRLPELRRRDGRDALVWLGRGYKAGKAGALVRALGVGALSVLAQGHLVADVLALVDVCRKTGKRRETRLNCFYYFLPKSDFLPILNIFFKTLKWKPVFYGLNIGTILKPSSDDLL